MMTPGCVWPSFRRSDLVIDEPTTQPNLVEVDSLYRIDDAHLPVHGDGDRGQSERLKKGKRELMSIERLLSRRGNRFFNLDSVQLLAPLSFGFAVTFLGLLGVNTLSTSAGDCATMCSICVFNDIAGALGEIRTHDPQIRGLDCRTRHARAGVFFRPARISM
jgi:hypothetical protein